MAPLALRAARQQKRIEQLACEECHVAYRSMQPCANPLYKLCHVLQPPTAAPCHQVGTTDSMISSSFGMLSFQHVQAMIYLKVSVSDFLTLFSARTQHAFW